LPTVPPSELPGQVALVPGACRGLGAAMARAPAGAGAGVALHAGRAEPSALAGPLASDHGAGSTCLVADLEQRAAVDAPVPPALDRFGRLDFLVNNAAIIRRADAGVHGDEDWPSGDVHGHVLVVDGGWMGR
jgi:NAD(P)-dependent dehydrogenase (short-subunit alcohol dehydrogenase family)